MKKIIMLLLALSVVFVFTACNTNHAPNGTGSRRQPTEPDGEPTAEPTAEPDGRADLREPHCGTDAEPTAEPTAEPRRRPRNP